MTSETDNPTAGAVTPFDFEGASVRVIERDGEPWFVLADVCRVLEIADPHTAARRLDDDEKATVNTRHLVPGIPTGRGNPNLTIISEPGLYAVIQRSDKPAARRFDRWVRHEVLPAIRKTGSYVAPSAPAPGVDVATIVSSVLETVLPAMDARIEARVEAMETRIVDRVCLGSVERAVMHEQGDFIRYVSSRSVCQMAGVDPKGRRGLTHRVSTALRRSGVPYRYDSEAESGSRYKFEPTAARAWARSPAGRAFVEVAASARCRARGGHLKVVPFQPPLPGAD